jgi:para-aminobenzoate synthetase component I
MLSEKILLEKLEDARAFMLCRNNGFPSGFQNQLCLSNSDHLSLDEIKPGTSYFGIIQYDQKNFIEPVFKKNVSQNSFFYQLQNREEFNNFPATAYNSVAQTIRPWHLSKEEYLRKANSLKEHIQAGDIYEINYCIPFVYENLPIDPFSVYSRLDLISSAPFSSYSRINDVHIISSSPERFLKKEGSRLFTEPMKGTEKRNQDPQKDHLLKEELFLSLKERTENIMIVDVTRNDLSRIASKGSVAVEQLYDVRSYKQVHQMVSKVSCQLKPDVTFQSIIHATFPMASMTGAPKIRAMQIIDAIEEMPRGPYSGCLGSIEENGDFDLSVLIRTIFYEEKTKRAWFWVGSAITALSDPEKEYEECLLKAKALREVLEN